MSCNSKRLIRNTESITIAIEPLKWSKSVTNNELKHIFWISEIYYVL